MLTEIILFKPVQRQGLIQVRFHAGTTVGRKDSGAKTQKKVRQKYKKEGKDDAVFNGILSSKMQITVLK